MGEQRELSIQEMQQANYTALAELDRICRENELTYYLMYGTLLGAVRHHGFIPWDDDVDVCMHRKDYEKLCTIIQNSKDDHYKLCDRSNTRNYPYYIPRFCNMDYQFVTTIDQPSFDIGAFVDIYILDNYCSDETAGRKLYKKMLRKNAKYMLYLTDKIGQNKAVHIAAAIGHQFLRLTKGGKYPQRIYGEMDRVLKKYTSEQDTLIGMPTWNFSFSQYDRETFSGCTELAFEGKRFLVPKDYHQLLTRWYGDYMELPPEEKRTASHSYKMYRRQ